MALARTRDFVDTDDHEHAGPSQHERFAALVDVFSWQVQHGCNSRLCHTATCFTNRLRTSRTPVRKYTPFTALPIALVLAGRNDARALVCPYLQLDIPNCTTTPPERIDLKALMQQLSCTKAVQGIHTNHQRSPSQCVLSSHLNLPHCVISCSISLTTEDFAQLDAYVVPADMPPGSGLESRQAAATYVLELCSNPNRLANSLKDVAFPFDVSPSASAACRFADISAVLRQRALTFVKLAGTALLENLVVCLSNISRHSPPTGTFLEVIFFCICILHCSSPFSRDHAELMRFRAELLEHGRDVDIDDKTHRCTQQIIQTLHDTCNNNRLIQILQSLRTEQSRVGSVEHGPDTTGSILVLLVQALIHRLWIKSCYVEQESPLCLALDFLRIIGLTGDSIVDIPLCMPLIAEAGLHIEEACVTFLAHSPADMRHIFSWPFILEDEKQWQIFRTVCYIRMRNASKESKFIELCRTQPGRPFKPEDELYLDRRLKTASQHYLVLKISRDDLLGNALDQLWHREQREILRPLRVRLGDEEGEIGVDQGGVQVEFFTLLCEQICRADSPLLATLPETNLSWLRPGSMEPLHRYELLGLLFAMAIYNGVVLPVSFPLVFYKKLLGYKTTLDDLEEAWPTQFKSMQWIANYDGDSIETDLAAEFSYSLESNGLVLELDILNFKWEASSDDNETLPQANATVHNIAPIMHHSIDKLKADAVHAGHELTSTPVDKIDPASLIWPGWRFSRSDTSRPAPVTMHSKRAYIDHYAKWVLDYSIRPQFYAFAIGFYYIMNPRTLHLLSPTNLRRLVEGKKTISADTLEKQATYVGYEESDAQVQYFWSVVRSYSQDQLQRLLEFVTASKRLPPGGGSGLRFVIQRHMGDVESLPSSSTCFGTLNLPAYPSEEMLKEKMDLALQYSIGFGIA